MFDPSTLPKTPKKGIRALHHITLEEGERIELPEYIAEKEKVRRETPVTKIVKQKDFSNIQLAKEIAKECI